MICFFVHKGLEKFCQQELMLRKQKEGTVHSSIVFVDADIDVVHLQTPLRIGKLLKHCTVTSLEDFEREVQDVEISLQGPISIDCVRQGDHLFSSNDLKPILAKHLGKSVEINYKVYTSQILVLLIDDQCYITEDVTGMDGSKRLYKVFHHSESLKGTIAASLLLFSQYDRSKVLIDPMMGSGIIPLEAALMALQVSPWQFDSKKLLKPMVLRPIEQQKLPIYGYDYQFRHLSTAQKNAKLAGVDKCLTLSKIDVEWLDTKHDEHSVDLIVTHPPEGSKRRNPKDIEKVQKELFHQAAFILKKDGKLVVIVRKADEFIELAKESFSVEEHIDFPYGSETMSFVKLKKV